MSGENEVGGVALPPVSLYLQIEEKNKNYKGLQCLGVAWLCKVFSLKHHLQRDIGTPDLRELASKYIPFGIFKPLNSTCLSTQSSIMSSN